MYVWRIYYRLPNHESGEFLPWAIFDSNAEAKAFVRHIVQYQPVGSKYRIIREWAYGQDTPR